MTTSRNPQNKFYRFHSCLIPFLVAVHWISAHQSCSGQANPKSSALISEEQIRNEWRGVASNDLRLAAESGKPAAQYYLSLLEFERSQSLANEAAKWAIAASADTTETPSPAVVKAKWGNANEADVRKAAIGGDHEAQQMLATSIAAKMGPHELQGMEWLQRAAEGSLAVAQLNLGWTYKLGLHQQKAEPRKAEKWIRAAADSGFENAQHRLSEILIAGDGIACDFNEGLEWLRKAADQGCIQAQFDLAQQYSCGNGEPRHEDETPIRLYAKAARAKLPDAQLILGDRYLNGLGVGKSRARAFFYFNLAATEGFEPAVAPRDTLQKTLTPDELQQVKELQAASERSSGNLRN